MKFDELQDELAARGFSHLRPHTWACLSTRACAHLDSWADDVAGPVLDAADAAYLNWGPCQVSWRGVVVFGGGLVGSVDARPYLGPRPGGR